MPSTASVELPLLDDVGRETGRLRILLLPGANANTPSLFDDRHSSERDDLAEHVQLVEDHEYRYELKVPVSFTSITSEPSELLWPDTDAGASGRLRPGSRTGRLPLRFAMDGVPLGAAAVEVRSRKLTYRQDYRRMLRGIADVMSEVVMERFAPTEQRFSPDHARDAATLYQRLAFLQNLLVEESFDAAMSYILARPHRGWRVEPEQHSPGQGIPGSSGILRQLSRVGPRVVAPASGLPSLPARLQVDRQEETLDTLPNRFVKFALERWRDVLLAITDALRREGAQTGPVERGLREASMLESRLDALLSQPLFREVGDLSRFPANDQVLHKRAGYRELFRSYVEFEVASKLAWDGGEDVYGAGQRDVATLYEYWAFFQLTRIIASICDVPIDLASLVEVRPDGLAIDLRRGRRRVLIGEVARLGRRLRVELWFNRAFHVSKEGPGTWSRNMRPDYSVRVTPVSPLRDSEGHPDDVWLHFDAKYRIENVAEIVGSDQQTITGDEIDSSTQWSPAKAAGGQPKAPDLLKMHAYRDAIRRSAGAYVLYPGTQRRDFREYHEILPGLGAFALRPGMHGEVDGEASLVQFIVQVVNHVASQLTQHERSRYWRAQSFSAATRGGGEHQAVPFLPRPAADTWVLLGFVRGVEHLQWIGENSLYNIRGGGRRGGVGLGSRELAADLVLLHGDSLDEVQLRRVIGEPRVMTRQQIGDLGYPSPSGDAYFCLPVGPPEPIEWGWETVALALRRLRRRLEETKPHGVPLTMSWLELMIHLEQEMPDRAS